MCTAAESLSDFSLPTSLLSLAFHGSQLRSLSLISLLLFLASIFNRNEEFSHVLIRTPPPTKEYVALEGPAAGWV